MFKYQDKKYSFEERAKDLLSLMTVEEKVNQMHVYENAEQVAAALQKGEFVPFGGLFNVTAIPADKIREIQENIINKSRLHIPLIVYGEGLHGLIHPNATVFPQIIGLSCSFDTELVEEMAKEIGRQAIKRGFNQLFAPNLDLARELRWGRVQETYGEDGFLAGELGSAYVRGVQSQGVAATVKHFVAHGTPENGLNLSSVHIGEREIRETMLPQFKNCLSAGASSVMPAYHELDGDPMHANKHWLKDVLRGELDFNGTVISDWGGIFMLRDMHHVAKDAYESGKLAINAGVDIEAPDYFGYGDEFKKAVERGDIPMEKIDDAVYRILLLKFRLGLFDKQEFDFSDDLRTEKNVALSLKAAKESIVLLKNDGTLPLKKGVKIAVIGPNGDKIQLGNYTYTEGDILANDKIYITPYKGICNEFGKENVKFAFGCRYNTYSEEDIARAEEIAKDSDVVIMALGDNSVFFGGVGWGNGDDKITEPVTCGEGFDVTSLELTAPQKTLLDRIAKLGKKTVLVMCSGRPMAITEEFAKSNAVIEAWYAGEQGGRALAEILSGKVNPSAKLTTSFPRSTGNTPCNYNHRVSARGCWYKKAGSIENPGRDYVFESPTALLPFGYGLSYTTFCYGEPKAKVTDKGVSVEFTLKNTGDRDGTEIALLFVKKRTAKFVPYEKELKAFKRVPLKSGEEKRVTLFIDKNELRFIDDDFTEKDFHGVMDLLLADKKLTVEI